MSHQPILKSLFRSALRTPLIILLLALVGFSSQAGAISGVTVTYTGDTHLVSDSNNSANAGPNNAYVSFQVNNTTGADIPNVKATLSFSGLALHPTAVGTFGFGGPTGQTPPQQQAAEQFVGTIKANSSRTVYWYVKYPRYTAAANTSSALITATVADAQPGTVTSSATIQTYSSISAQAGGLLNGTTLGPGAIVGQLITYSATYSFGNAEIGDEVNLQPAGNDTFAAGCFQLVGSTITRSDLASLPVGAISKDRLYFVMTQKTTGSGNIVKVDYFYQYRCVGVGTTANSYASQTSGNTNVKYSGNYGGATGVASINFPGATQAFTLTKTASPTNLFNGGIVTYTLKVTNTSATLGSYVDRITDALPTTPANATLTSLSVAGTAGVITTPSTLPSNGATGTLEFIGTPLSSFYIPAQGVLTLTYTTTIPPQSGTYTNSATLTTGASTTAPVTVSVTNSGPTNLGISKTFTPTTIKAGNTTTLTLTVTNPNAVVASNLNLTDPVAASMGFATPMLLRVTANTCGGTTSASENATGVLTLTGGSVAANSTCTVTVAFTPSTPPVGTFTNTIAAANLSATVGGSTVMGAAPASAALTVTAGAAGSGYICDPNFYQIRQDPTTLLSNLYRLDLTNLASGGVAQWTEGFGPALNAMGYNPVDQYFYAVNINPLNVGSPFRLFKLGQAGAVEHASLTNIPAGSTIAAATVDRDGVMYIKKLQQDSVIYRYNLVTNTPLANLNLTASLFLWDLAVHPTTNLIYGAVTPGGIWTIDPTTGLVVPIGTAASLDGTSSNAIGTLFFDFNGTLFAYQNGGTFGTINLTTGAFENPKTAASAVQSDGGSCAFAYVNVSVVKTGAAFSKPAASLLYTLKVQNTSTIPALGVVLTDSLPTGTTYVGNTGGGIYTAGNNTVTWTIGTIPAMTTQTYTVEVTSPANATTHPTITNTATVTSTGERAVDTSDNQSALITKLVFTTLGKTVANLSATPPTGPQTTVSGKPGDVLEYCLAFSNPGGADLPNFTVTDDVPSNVKVTLAAPSTSTTIMTPYGGKSIQLTRGGAATDFTAASGDDAGTLTSSGGALGQGKLTVALGTLLSQESGKVCFQGNIR